jgi:hypothetical protein
MIGRATCAALAALLASAVAVSAAAAHLRMTVRPGAFAFAPADVEVRLHVEPGGRQREVQLVVDGPNYYAAHQLNIRAAADTPTVQPPTWFTALPVGAYVITATLTDCAPSSCARREQLARAIAYLQVKGFDEDAP